jgi:2-dehydro-3-deoxyglucarate aldolase
MDFDAYVAEAQEALVIAQIEHVDAIAQLPDIARVEGLDAVMIGPYDLSASLGCTGDLTNPKVLDAIDRIREACREHGMPVGTHVVTPDPDALRSRIAEGYQFIAYGVDTTFLRSVSSRPTA